MPPIKPAPASLLAKPMRELAWRSKGSVSTAAPGQARPRITGPACTPCVCVYVFVCARTKCGTWECRVPDTRQQRPPTWQQH
eukprot:1138063-Pelagomonas_calceolata.AAC.1